MPRADLAVDDARRMLADVQQLDTRMHTHERRSQQVDRRAEAYASRLARRTARLLAHMPHAAPAVRPVPGSGASSLRHYVLRHDVLKSPDRLRLLVVSSDGRLRLCTMVAGGRRARLWSDYEVTNPPPGLGLESVFEGLSSLMVQVESSVAGAESELAKRELAMDNLIAGSDALLARMEALMAPGGDSDAEDGPEGTGDAGDAGDSSAESLTSHGFEHRILERPNGTAAG